MFPPVTDVTTPPIGDSPGPTASRVNCAITIAGPVTVLDTSLPAIKTLDGGSFSVHSNKPLQSDPAIHDPLTAVTRVVSSDSVIWKFTSGLASDRTRTCTINVDPTVSVTNCNPVWLPRSTSPSNPGSKLHSTSAVACNTVDASHTTDVAVITTGS